jgi:Tfp pilus assembly protein PilF/4-amino-4-deoxy-L-arabinose transferase-like glycosyltransferase
MTTTKLETNSEAKADITQSIGGALGLSVIAVLLRLVYLIEWSSDPGFTALMVDEKWHWLWAGEILDNSFWGEGAWFRGPLYPYFLALLRWLTDDSIFWAKAFQLLLSGTTCFFTVRLSEFLFGKRAGIIAGIFYTFYGTLFFYDSMFLVEALFWPLCIWGVHRLVVYAESERWQSWGLTGVIFGLAALTRPNILLVASILCLWMVWKFRGSVTLYAKLRRPFVFGLALVLTILPVTIRNYMVTGEFILISSQGGVNFYIGNNPVANGLSMVMPEVQLDESVAWDQFIPTTNAAAEREAGKTLRDAEVSDFWTKKTLDWISRNPSDFLSLTARKCAYLVSGFENSDNGDIYFHRAKSRIYSALLWDAGIYMPWGLLLPLTVLGLALTWQVRKQVIPVYLFMIAYIPTVVLFLVTARHRMVLVPLMIVVSAGGLGRLLEICRAISFRRGVTIAIGFGLLLLASNRLYFEAGRGAEFQNYYGEGLRLMAVKDFSSAEKQFTLANESWPHSATAVNNLGYVQYMQGKDSAAVANYLQSIQIDTSYYQPYNNLGLVMVRRGFLDSARALFLAARSRINDAVEHPDDVAQVRINLGDALFRTGRIEAGKRQFDSAIAIAGSNVHVVTQIATICSQRKQYAFADTIFQFASQSDKMSATEWFNWGVMRLEWQKWAEAEYPLRRCLEEDPQMASAWYCMAFAKLQLGEPRDKVLGLLDRALLIDPKYQQAVNLKNQILLSGR